MATLSNSEEAVGREYFVSHCEKHFNLKGEDGGRSAAVQWSWDLHVYYRIDSMK